MKKQLISLFLAFSLITLTKGATDCDKIENANSQQIWQIMKMSYFDRIFLLTAGSLSIVLLIFALISWNIFRSFSTPSDILFVIAISQLIQNVTLLVEAGIFLDKKGYFTQTDTQTVEPESFNHVCFGLGIMNIFGNVLSIYYNLIFCVILAYSIQKTLKGFLFNRFRYHIISFILTSVIILVVTLTESLGRALNGVCGFKIANKESFLKFIIEIMVCAICIYSMYCFRTKMPKNQFFANQTLFGYYFIYMGVFVLTQLTNTISYLASDIMCKLNVDNVIFKLHIFYSIGIVASIFLSYFVVFIRFKHPLLVKKFRKKFGIKENKNQNQDHQQTSIPQLKDLSQDEAEDESWLGCLLESLKGSQILSFLQGITVDFIEKERKYTQRQLSVLTYKKSYTFCVNQEIVQNYIERRVSFRQSFLVQKQLGGLVGLDYSVTSFHPQVFSSLFTRQELVQVIRSLDIKKNIKIVKQQSHMNGGKSGQLFFGTFDNRLILKSIREDEALSYLQKIREFTEYFRKQPQSLIVKILGIFKFVRNDIKEAPIYIILMQNITLLPKNVNIRVYDIKGSEFNRSTIEENRININSSEQKQERLKRLTLKDKDFKLLESKIKIESRRAREVKKMAQKDIQFLGSQGFIDYSLVIIKRQGNYNSRQDSRLSEIGSAEEAGVIYNFGIIDYLESWTLKRKAQRVLKTLITNEQVTVNSPINYSQRLCQFIETIM